MQIMQTHGFNEHQYRISLSDEILFQSLLKRYQLLLRIKDDCEKNHPQCKFRPLTDFFKTTGTPSVLSVIQAQKTNEFLSNVRNMYLVSESDFFAQLTDFNHDFTENIRRIVLIYGRELAFEFLCTQPRFISAPIPLCNLYDLLLKTIFPNLLGESFILRRATREQLSYDYTNAPHVRIKDKTRVLLCETLEKSLLQGFTKTLLPEIEIDSQYYEWNGVLIRCDTLTL